MSEVARLPDREPQSILNIIASAAFNPEFDVVKFEKLLEMQERFEARQLERERRDAERVFIADMSAAQGKMRPVVRDAYNSQTHSRYTRLDTIDDAIRPIYTEHGFHLTFGTGTPVKPGNIRVICRCAHRAGHVETYELEEAPDITGAQGRVNKTVLHGMGSTISYLRRYLKTMIFDVVLATEDDDGNEGGGKIRNIASGMGENSRREPAPAPGNKADAWLTKFALQASLIRDSEEADKLITGRESLFMRDLFTKHNDPRKARYDEIVFKVMQTWLSGLPEGDPDAEDEIEQEMHGLTERGVPKDGSDAGNDGPG